jgi:hypothetical protein
VRPLAERLVAVRAKLRELEDEQREVVHIIAGNGSGYAVGEARGEDFSALATELETTLEALLEFGVDVKDLDSGLIDFPSLRHGEEVLLCWQVGEESVEYWHDHEAGFTGRQPIDWDD